MRTRFRVHGSQVGQVYPIYWRDGTFIPANSDDGSAISILHWRSPCSSASSLPIPIPRQRPFGPVIRPIRQVSLCLSAPSFRFLGHLVPAGASISLTGDVLIVQTPSGLPRSAYPSRRRRLRLSSAGSASAWRDDSAHQPGHLPFWCGLVSLFSPFLPDEGSDDGSL